MRFAPFSKLRRRPTTGPSARISRLRRSRNHRPGLGIDHLESRTLLYGGVTEFGGFTGQPGGITLLPDGKTFFLSEQPQDKIALFDIATSAVTEFQLPAGTKPHAREVGPDGNVWFTGLGGVIGEFNVTSHAITLFKDGLSPGADPHEIITGPDGNLYFPEESGNRIGEFNMTTRTISELATLPANTGPHGLAIAPDGNLLFGTELTSTVMEFNLKTHAVTPFLTLAPGSDPHELLIGPDGNLYIALLNANELAQYNFSTKALTLIPTSLTASDPPSVLDMTIGPDGNIWFTEFQADRIGTYNIATHAVTEYRVGITPFSHPLVITSGPDGALWFGEPNINQQGAPGRIARLDPAAAARFLNPNNAFVETVYQALFSRDASDKELAKWSGQIAKGKGLTQVAYAIAKLPDFRVKLFSIIYTNDLGRPPTTAEINSGLKFIKRGNTFPKFESVLLGNASFIQNQGGGTVQGWADSVYNAFFARKPTADEVTTINSELASGESYQQIAYALNTNQERVTRLTSINFGRFLLRSPSDAESAFYGNALSTTQSSEFVDSLFLGLPEYSTKWVTGPTPLPPGVPSTALVLNL